MLSALTNLSIEEKQFISRLEDRLDRVEQRYQEEITDFLEPRMQLVAEGYLRSVKFQRYLFCGGYEAAERKRLVLFPEYTEPDCEMAGIRLFRFQGKLDYVSVTHRDFLGAIMG
ncbi:MAG: RNA-binding protein, partial [Peptococcaceae bacterium]|nr:RNA-binding protein [Peptococcaceae bacterium]